MASPPPRFAAAVIAALALHAGLALASSRTKSSTFDEVVHLPPGYLSLTLGDHRLNPDHPPLSRRLAALPLLFMDVKWEKDDLAFRTGRPWEFGKRFLYRWNDAETLLFVGRLPNLALTLSLLLAVTFFARRHYGEPAALLTLFLAALYPDLLAHGVIVSTEVGITLFVFLTVLAFGRLLVEVTPARVLLAGLALGAACAMKFSGVALLPILGIVAALVGLDGRPLHLGHGQNRRELRSRREKLGVLAVVLLAVSIVAIPTIWAAYGFHYPIAADPEANARIFDWREVHLSNPMGQRFFELLRVSRLLPEAWVWGFLHFLVHAGGRPAFLLGQYSEGAFWNYFPVTFALKTPVPLLILLALGASTARRTAADRRVEWLLFVPPVFLFLLSVFGGINIGHRHLLPIYPFLFVIGGRVASLAFGPHGASRPLALAVGVLGLGQAMATAQAYPSYLAYFNEIAGGSRNGWRYLVDSNLDWGQDLKGLRRWMEQNGVPEVKLAYFGTADVRYYGVAGPRLPGYQPAPRSATVYSVAPGDVVAVSATLLQGVYAEPGLLPLVERLRVLPPVAVIGHSIFIYRPTFSWTAIPADAEVATPPPSRDGSEP